MALAALVQPYADTPYPNQRTVTTQLVQKLHHCIECCLVRRMTLAQTITLLESFGFQQTLTEIVWKQLEVQNPQFFSLYTQQLIAKG